MNTRTIDLDLLRTLIAFDECGSLARAGERIGRSESAVSLQMKRLEEAIGERLFSHAGRKLILTQQGYAVVHYGRRMLAINDELLSCPSQTAFSGPLRIAASQDFGEEILPAVLKELAQAYPRVRFEVEVEGGIRGLNKLDKREVDVVLTLGLHDHASAHRLQRARLVWIGSAELTEQVRRPIPLVVFSQPCRFKQRAIDVLNQANIPWHIVFKTPSLAGLWAAARANIGLTVRSSYWIPSDLNVIDARKSGLPDLGEVDVDLHYFEESLSSSLLEMVKRMERSLVLRTDLSNTRAATSCLKKGARGLATGRTTKTVSKQS